MSTLGRNVHARIRFAAGCLLLAILMLAPIAAFAALDAPSVLLVDRGHGKLVIEVTAGPSGAPNGFSVFWMTRQEFQSIGSVWPEIGYPTLSWATFTGRPSLNTFDLYRSFKLEPFQTIRVELGDIECETGVNSNNRKEMKSDVDYVMCAYAEGSSTDSHSDHSPEAEGEPTTQGLDCTYTQGYWKNHATAWPVSGLKLGTVIYTKSQLLQILDDPTKGNGLVSLAKQLIAAKLNIYNGADGSPVASAIADADALIGGLVIPPIGSGGLYPSVTSDVTQALDDYNNGITGPGHCGETSTRPNPTWGELKSLYR
jgi:hypothetical protein